MKIIIDTREQTPWTFPEGIQTETGTLATGDYSLKGLQEICTIERKSLSDLVGCMTGDNRERFKKELLRLKSYRCRAVIIEGSLHDIMIRRYLSRIEPEAVIGSMASWQTKYETPFIMAGDAEGAARYCLAIFRTFHNQCREFSKQFNFEE
jgi:ERCC4-type nuclease